MTTRFLVDTPHYRRSETKHGDLTITVVWFRTGVSNITVAGDKDGLDAKINIYGVRMDHDTALKTAVKMIDMLLSQGESHG